MSKPFCNLCGADNVAMSVYMCDNSCKNTLSVDQIDKDRVKRAIDLVKDDDKDPYVREYLEAEDKREERHGRNI